MKLADCSAGCGRIVCGKSDSHSDSSSVFHGDLAVFWSSLHDDSMEGYRVRGSGRGVKGLTWESCCSLFSHGLLC